jgi:hypothetical protein
VRRVLVRAGIVLGGAVAGTAAAWLMSMSSASADTTTPQVVQPVVDTLTAPGQTKPGTIPQFVEHVVDTAAVTPPAPPKEIEDFGKHVQGAFDQFGKQVTTQLTLPANRDASEIAGPAKLRMLAIGDHDSSPVVHPLEVTPQTAQQPASGRERVTAHDNGRRPATESSRRAPPSDQSPALPVLPPLPAPLVPPTAPAGACNSCGHGSDDDLGVPVSHTWPALNTGLATSRALRMSTQHVATAVGEQPGVTPD